MRARLILFRSTSDTLATLPDIYVSFNVDETINEADLSDIHVLSQASATEDSLTLFTEKHFPNLGGL